MSNSLKWYDFILEKSSLADGLPPLLFRLILSPVMMQAGWNKLSGWENTVAWFGDTDWGLGLPLPTLMAFLAVATELVGGAFLLVGFAVRWAAIPLMITMLVAAFAVHWENGWLAISDSTSWLANERVMEAAARKEKAISILKEHGHYSWLTGKGSITILNNGVEFAVTYFVMLFSLFFTGAGRFFSVDYWLKRHVKKLSDQQAR